MQRLLTLSLLLALGLVGFASKTFFTPDVELEEWVWDMGDDTSGIFTSSCAGDFDGDGLRDFVCLRDGVVEIVGDPGLYGWWVDQIVAASDIALWQAERPQPDGFLVEEGLLTVGAAGLELRTNFGQVDAGGVLDPDLENLAAGAWLNAEHIATAWSGTEAGMRIVGCMQDLRTLRTLRHDGSAYVDEPLSLAPGLNQDIQDLLLVDMWNDGVPEVALLLPNRIRVHDLATGMIVANHVLPAGWTYETMTKGRQGDGAAEWIAAVSNLPGGVQQYLGVVDANGLGQVIYLSGDPGVVRMAAGDVDLDGNSDLVLSLDGVSEVWVLYNGAAYGASPTFSLAGSNLKTIPYPTDPPGAQVNQAEPAVCDVDGDEDPEVLLPVQSTSRLYVVYNPAVAEGDHRPGLVETLGADPRPSIQRDGPSQEEPDPLLLEFEFVPPQYQPPTATHLQLAVFYQQSPDHDTNPEAVWSIELDWPLVDGPFVEGNVISIHLPGADFLYPPPAPLGEEVHFSNLFTWHQRLISQDGARRKVHPAAVYGVETSDSEFPDPSDNSLYFQDFSGEEESLAVHYACPTCQINPDIVGTVTPLPCLPKPPQEPVIVPN